MQEKRLERLSAEGFNKRELTKIHGPIGLDIYSKTPEEISISILAELTKYRRKKNCIFYLFIITLVNSRI